MCLPQIIHHGDCVEFIREMRLHMSPNDGVTLIFADPPFNIKYKYDNYKDSLALDKYLDWTAEWMSACYGILSDNGSFYIAIRDELAADIVVIARKLGLHLRRWIVWHYSFGQAAQKNFTLSHTHILYFVKNPKSHTFNDKDIRIKSDRQIKYNDKRANPDGKLPNDVWVTKRIAGTHKERMGWHGCQMPEEVLERIILASSNIGDVVFDPFCGSGTTAAVAKKKCRGYITCDISEKYVEHARKRLSAIEVA